MEADLLGLIVPEMPPYDDPRQQAVYDALRSLERAKAGERVDWAQMMAVALKAWHEAELASGVPGPVHGWYLKASGERVEF